MVTTKQSMKALSVLLLVMMTVFISSLFAVYNANLSLARDVVELKADNAELLIELDGKASMGNMIMTMSLISLGITSLMSLIMYISRHINENQASMGVLKAMGYRNGQIAGSYALFGIPVFTGAVSGFFISFLLEPHFEKLLNANIALPEIERNFPLPIFAIFVIAPVIFFSLFSALTARIKLRRPALAMIRENVSLKTGVLARRYAQRKSNHPFLKELSSTVVRGNMLLLFFVAFAGLAFGNQLQLGFAVSSMTDKVLDRTFEGVSYTSNVRFIRYGEQAPISDGLPYTALYGEVLFREEILAHGELVLFQSVNELLRLLDIDGKQEIDLGALDGVVVNDWLRRKYNLSLGDIVTFEKDGKTFILTIAAFERSAFGETIYCGYEYAQKSGIIESVYYNGVYTAETVSFNPGEHIFVSTVEDIRGEFQEQKDTYRSLSSLFFVIALLLGIITLQIALRIVVNANRKYIAMLKAYGYSQSERNRAILSKYRPVAYVGFAVGIGYAYVILAVLFGMTAKASNMYVPVTVDAWSWLASLLLFIAAYELMITMYKHRINSISLKEIMID